MGSSAFGYPRRLTIGYDQYRLLIIIAILEKRAHLNLSNQDVYINARVLFTILAKSTILSCKKSSSTLAL